MPSLQRLLETICVRSQLGLERLVLLVLALTNKNKSLHSMDILTNCCVSMQYTRKSNFDATKLNDKASTFVADQGFELDL